MRMFSKQRKSPSGSRCTGSCVCERASSCAGVASWDAALIGYSGLTENAASLVVQTDLNRHDITFQGLVCCKGRVNVVVGKLLCSLPLSHCERIKHLSFTDFYVFSLILTYSAASLKFLDFGVLSLSLALTHSLCFTDALVSSIEIFIYSICFVTHSLSALNNI